jgi:hypothetical protein
MTGTITGDSSRYYLSSVRNKVSENLVVLVVDDSAFVCTETADLSSMESSSAISTRSFCHLFLLLVPGLTRTDAFGCGDFLGSHLSLLLQGGGMGERKSELRIKYLSNNIKISKVLHFSTDTPALQ